MNMMASTPPPPPQPTIGRIVHYYDGTHGPHAAIVIYVCSSWVDLQVFDRDGSVYARPCVYFAADQKPRNGEYWTWPPRV